MHLEGQQAMPLGQLHSKAAMPLGLQHSKEVVSEQHSRVQDLEEGLGALGGLVAALLPSPLHRAALAAYGACVDDRNFKLP